MLEFFRKYQKYFFFVITVVIIISFSFFGTYSTIGSTMWRDQVAFKAVNGHDVSRADVDEMALFLATDSSDKQLFNGVWGPNFLNDGVIEKDFLQTGLGAELALAYAADLQGDIDKRLAKEKKFVLYTHPQAPFMGVESVWSYFAPQIPVYFHGLKQATNGLEPTAFSNRINLYLAQKQLPTSTLRYILRFQEKQYADWLKPDQRLNQIDLSLFGYHTFEDWFGPSFTRLISEFIINAAILAEQKGYAVSNAEVLSDFVRSTQISYQQNINQPTLGVASAEEYLSEQLRRLNMDQARAIKIWRQVLLFRRYFHDAGSSALMGGLAVKKMADFAHESVTVDLYQLPSSLKIANHQDLQNLEAYLYAVAKLEKGNPLALPEQFLQPAQVIKKYPELVQKRYLLEIAKVDLKTIQAKIGLRQLWEWEIDEKNWALLTKQFPLLKAMAGESKDERFDALEGLAPSVRAAVDAYAKQQIVEAHPEWIDQALAEAKPDLKEMGIRMQGGNQFFNGLEDQEKRKNFIHLLDTAPLGRQVPSDSALFRYSADRQAYFRIAVLARGDQEELLTFDEARSDGTLEAINQRILEQHYVAIRTKDTSLYQNDKKEWRPFQAVKENVVDDYYKKIMSGLEPVQKEVFGKSTSEYATKDELSSLRLYPYIKSIRDKLVQNPSSATHQWAFRQETASNTSEKALSNRLPLSDQWKVEKLTLTVDRQAANPHFDIAEALSLKQGDWSSILVRPDGSLAFFEVKAKDKGSATPAQIAEKVRKAQALLGAEAERNLMKQVIEELKAKEAISLSYMRPSESEVEPQQIEVIEE